MNVAVMSFHPKKKYVRTADSSTVPIATALVTLLVSIKLHPVYNLPALCVNSNVVWVLLRFPFTI